jgi:hypothetical protein
MRTLGTRAVVRSGALCVVLATSFAALTAALPGRLRATAVDPGDPARLDALLVTGAVVALLVVTGGATLLALAALFHALGSARATRALVRCCPAPWRRPLLLACGLAVVATAPAYAAGDGSTSPLAGRPSLDRPVGSVPAVAADPPARPARADRSSPVRVRAGDSLWRIVVRRHPAAADAEVARLVTALYRVNRAVIGDDPDLIRPGQVLRPADVPTDTTRRSPS